MDGTVVRALSSHQCGSGSIPRLGIICGLGLLLVLILALRGFSPGTPVFPSPQKPTFPNSHLILGSEGHRFVSRNRLLSVILIKQSQFIYLFIYCLVDLPPFIYPLDLRKQQHTGVPWFAK